MSSTGNIRNIEQLHAAICEDRVLNIAGDFVRYEHIVGKTRGPENAPVFRDVSGRDLVGTPTVRGDVSELLYRYMSEGSYSGRSEDLPPMAIRPSTMFYLRAEDAGGNGGDTFTEVAPSFGPTIAGRDGGNITVVTNEYGRWLQGAWDTVEAVAYPGTEYENQSVAGFFALEETARNFARGAQVMLDAGYVQLINNSNDTRLNFKRGSSATASGGYGGEGYVSKFAFFRPAGKAEGTMWRDGNVMQDRANELAFTMGAQQTNDALVRTDVDRTVRINFVRLERGISRNDYHRMLEAFQGSGPLT